ncbi:MAG TPA: hypothetical protein VLV89_12625, partial [Candidatus Acidoferrum sp.]|nr:hypothetical protein [Candidatus Acidoferrum sp.]
SRRSRRTALHSMQFALIAVALIVLAPARFLGRQATLIVKQMHFDITVSFAPAVTPAPVDGRLFLVFATNANSEPRFQMNEQEARSAQFFGMDGDNFQAGKKYHYPEDALGYPARSLSEIPAGDYYVQAVFNKYTAFHLSNGHTVKLPMDEGEGQHWDRKPGNLYSKPEKIHFDPAATPKIDITLDQVIPPLPPVADTDLVKHIRIQSDLLTKFYGRPMYLGGIVVLPAGWQDHPNAHYPLLVNQGHFQRDFNGFRNNSPLFQDWTTGKLPHILILIIQHANPYYDDSYAVNSANVGPYGDAINHELIPYVEKQFRGIGAGWARALYGGSTGGWETLATQIFYPDDYNGAWGACPDPVDFHAYQSVNIYDSKNAYWEIGPFGRVPRPDMRGADGLTEATNEGANRYELVMGTHSRSGEQWDIWQAVFSPVGDDGYPKEIWDQRTGEINKDVAEYWRQHYDLTAIMQRDWKTLGPKLNGKLHVMVGMMDTYFLDNAVHLMQNMLEKTTDPHYAGDFDYGPGQPHCYTGPPGATAREGSATFTQRVLKASADWMLKTAPQGADTTSWRY